MMLIKEQYLYTVIYNEVKQFTRTYVIYVYNEKKGTQNRPLGGHLSLWAMYQN